MLFAKQEIGRLDRLITFQQKIVGQNESNEDAEDGWVNIANFPTCYASKDDKTGNEMYAADKLTGFQDVIFTIRWRSDVSIENRIVCDGIKYDIHSIQEVGRKRFLQITAERGKDFVTLQPGDDFDNGQYAPDYE